MPVVPGTYNYWLAPYVWRDDFDLGERWDWPTGAIHTIDLRPVPARALKNIANGLGFFPVDPAAPNPRGGVLLGSDMGARLTLSQRIEMESALGLLSGDLDEPTLTDSLWAALTTHGDATGVNAPRPLVPDRSGNIRISLRGHSVVKREPFSRAAHDWVRLMQIENLKRQGLQGGAQRDELRRIKDRYGYEPTEIVAPSGGAVFTDNFNRANEALGTSANWTEVDGSWSIVSNQVEGPGTAGSDFPSFARCDSTRASNSHYAQVEIISDSPDSSSSHLPGAAVAAAGSGEDYYSCDVRDNVGTSQLREVNTGTATVLDSATVNPAFPYTVYIEYDGGSIDVLLDTVSIMTATDSTHDANRLTGMTNHSSAATTGQFDDYETDDISAGAAPARRHLMTLGVGR